MVRHLIFPVRLSRLTMPPAACTTTSSPTTSGEATSPNEGTGVPKEQISLAFRLVFQRADRTLVDAEVSRSVERVIRAVAQRFGAALREGEAGRGESQ